jgi:hypothetical protein
MSTSKQAKYICELLWYLSLGKCACSIVVTQKYCNRTHSCWNGKWDLTLPTVALLLESCHIRSGVVNVNVFLFELDISLPWAWLQVVTGHWSNCGATALRLGWWPATACSQVKVANTVHCWDCNLPTYFKEVNKNSQLWCVAALFRASKWMQCQQTLWEPWLWCGNPTCKGAEDAVLILPPLATASCG